MGKRKTKPKAKSQTSGAAPGLSSDILALDEAFARGDYASVIAMRDRIVAKNDDPLTKDVQAAYGSLELDPGILKLSVATLVMYAIGWVVALI